MTGSGGKGPSIVFVLKDGIRGHDNQSAGVAEWLRNIAGADISWIDIPRLKGWKRFFWNKIKAGDILGKNVPSCLSWIEGAGGNHLLEEIRDRINDAGVKAESVLFISAGSSGAPFCLALSRVTGSKCCCIMTPSVLGTKPFDFAIVPEHDFPQPSPNLLATLGAPNMIRPELLDSEGAMLAARYPSEAAEKWGILTGGDDANYTIPPEWVEEVLDPLLQTAEKNGADVYITTSRRTHPDTEERISEMVKYRSNIRMLVLGTREKWNPVPGMLAICSRIFCTEDSVSMISEAATAGHVVHILRVGKQGGVRKILQDLTAAMVDRNLLARGRLWGVPRFDLMIESFCAGGFAANYDPVNINVENIAVRHSRAKNSGLNEARRAAEWIIQRWRL